MNLRLVAAASALALAVVACGPQESPAHAGLYGRGIGVGEVVFPLGHIASVWSAYGLSLLDHARTFEANAAFATPLAPAPLAAAISRLESAALAYAQHAGLDEIQLERLAGMKYPLQVHEVEIECPAGPVDQRFTERLVETFHRAYEARYGAGTGYAEAGAEITSLRVCVRSPADAHPLLRQPVKPSEPKPASTRGVYWRELGGRVETPIFTGDEMTPGATLSGPAVVEYPHTTIAVRPDQRLRSDGFGNLVLRFDGAGQALREVAG